MLKYLLVFFFFLAVPHLTCASTIQLPRTGQTACYTAGVSVPYIGATCDSSGQDGAIQAGKPWPNPPFTDTGNGTVTDNVTGLVWLKNADCMDTVNGITPRSGNTWSEALTWSNGMTNGKCGLTDASSAGQWRLPNILEQGSMVVAMQTDRTSPFYNTQGNNYWSSTSTYDDVFHETIAFTAYADYIGWSYYNRLAKYDGQRMWPVRNGQSAATAELPATGQALSYASGDDGSLRKGVAWPTPRFIDNANGTVTDNLTGLVWLKNANCTDTVGGISKTSGTLGWSNALAWSNYLASGKCGLSDGSQAADWRLPNWKEQMSLVNWSERLYPLTGYWLTTQGFNLNSAGSFWTSSTYTSETLYMSAISMGLTGKMSASLKTDSIYAWPVRGGHFGNATISVSPSVKDFGVVAPGGSGSQVVTIANTAAAGSSRLQVNAIALSGANAAEFSINVGTCGRLTPIIPAGSSCTVTVTYRPVAAGNKNSSFRVSGSDVNTPNVDIPLSGSSNGYVATASVSGGNGSITSASSRYVAGGATTSFTLAPATNYQPSSSVGGTCAAGSFNGNTYTTGVVPGDCTVEFSFTKKTYPLTITYAGTGSGAIGVQPAPPGIDCTGTCSQSFEISTLVTLVPTPDSTSLFSDWTGCPAVSGNQCTVTMTAAKSVTATFTRVYVVTASMSGGGTVVTTNPLSVSSGAQATFTLEPTVGYLLEKSVTGTCPSGVINNSTYTTGPVTNNCTVLFNFTRPVLNIVFAGTGSGTIVTLPKPPATDCTNSCNQAFDNGTVVTLTPTFNVSNVFSGWSRCPLLSGNQCLVTMTEVKSVYAYFNLLAGENIKVNGSTFGTVSGALGALLADGEINLKTGDIHEVLTFNQPISITMRGGYNSDFTAVTGMTNIHGSVNITTGTVTLDGITIL